MHKVNLKWIIGAAAALVLAVFTALAFYPDKQHKSPKQLEFERWLSGLESEFYEPKKRSLLKGSSKEEMVTGLSITFSGESGNTHINWHLNGKGGKLTDISGRKLFRIFSLIREGNLFSLSSIRQKPHDSFKLIIKSPEKMFAAALNNNVFVDNPPAQVMLKLLEEYRDKDQLKADKGKKNENA